MNDKRFLGAVFALELTEGAATVRGIAERTGSDALEVASEARKLRERGLLKKEVGKVSLTSEGRNAIRVVLIGGGFEIIHPGHIYTIEQAKRLGEVLVVVVARDSTIRRGKGREPVAGERERVQLLSSLRQVDVAILGGKGNIYRTLGKVRPDVVALGYDQHHVESEILQEGEKRGMRLEVVRLDTPRPRIKTSRLLREI